MKEFQHKLFDSVPPWAALLLGIGVIAVLHQGGNWLEKQAKESQNRFEALKKPIEQSSQIREHYSSLRELKGEDVNRFKAGFSGLAKSRKALFETGLSLQEERRLLEKQLEIMTTTLLINPALQRVFVMRGDQPLAAYLISYIPPQAFGGVPDTVPGVVRIISKERFAHPERGTSEQVNGTLTYEPPQVGTSIRSNALGEFVIFTNSKLILHGPSVNPEDHEKFPHVCIGLDLEAARRLYRSSFIGTRIVLKTR